MADIDRFMNKIIKQPSGCWEWQAYIDPDGYARFGNKDLPNTLAHRWSYWYHKGLLHPKMFVCHSCDNRKCVNPDHLWLGSNNDNQLDKKNKNRSSDNQGRKNPNAKLTEQQVFDIKYNSHDISVNQLALTYNVSKVNIYDIKKGVRWKHV